LTICKSISANDWNSAQPVYTKLPGFTLKAETNSWNDLPAPAKGYIAFIEYLLETPIKQVSLGPKRRQIIDVVTEESVVAC